MSVSKRLVRSRPAPVAAPEYRKAIVSYLDILGFKELVSASASVSPEEVRRTVLQVHRQLKHDEDDDDIQSGRAIDIAFSDTVLSVHFVPRDEDPKIGALFWELDRIQTAQIELLARGILVRGGVTIADVFVDSKAEVWFGPGIVESYELEQNADFPRIILHPRLASDFVANPGLRNPIHTHSEELDYIRRIVRPDIDGISYVDPFTSDAGQFDAGFEGMVDWYRLVRAHLIGAARKYANQQRVLRKYAWLASNYQRAVASHFQSPLKEELALLPAEFPGLSSFG